KPASEEEPKNVESYELPEENTGFTMGDILGDALKEEVEEKATDDSEK
ncbi:30S ribosomal protein S1, partial [Enterococcus faecium]|nr:30S ribosomal protein S1 [Enterococcus faecium]HAR0161044.1 30S ribosomal protein S1 [Enterococcus faecium]